MQNKDLVFGIDTSNYTTSLAVARIDGTIAKDIRKLLTIKQGERGLRQSHALFQHMENLPEMVVELFSQIDKDRIGAVAASDRPRPVQDSYMPVFKAGVNYGKVMAASLGVPFFEFSHQEGHLEAAGYGSPITGERSYLAWHLSGGTSELLHIKENAIHILGGSRDLSFGQVIDRVGVALGLGFPAGREMDLMALKMRDKEPDGKSGEKAGKQQKNGKLLKKIPVDGLEFNLSGIETQCQRELTKGADPGILAYELFQNISQSLCRLTEQGAKETGCNWVLWTGGVAASRFIREEIQGYFADKPLKPVFGDPSLSSDNAAGISLLGGKALWQSNR